MPDERPSQNLGKLTGERGKQPSARKDAVYRTLTTESWLLVRIENGYVFDQVQVKRMSRSYWVRPKATVQVGAVCTDAFVGGCRSMQVSEKAAVPTVFEQQGL
jgi:hypothetical protein